MSASRYKYLCSFMSPARRQMFDRIAALRTRHLTVVLEDVYQAMNASAVLRTCEALGVQDVYVAENVHSFMVRKRVAKGAGQWLTLHRFNEEADNSTACFDALKKNGYRLLVASADKNGISPGELDLNQKSAIVLGTELHGPSAQAIACADASLHIPMYGFTESYNVSVAAAIILFQLVERLRKSDIKWELSEEEQLELKLTWARLAVRSSEQLLKHFDSSLHE